MRPMRCFVGAHRFVYFLRQTQQNATFFAGGGSAHPGDMTSNSNSAEIFVQITYPQVSASCVYSFRSYSVDKHTNKQTDACENIATTLGKNITGVADLIADSQYQVIPN